MYTSFYNLDSKPFEDSSDPSFLWLGEKHKEALSSLRYGLLGNKGFLFLAGEAGIGKTTLINALTQVLDKDVEWAVITDPSLERIDFYNAIAKGFGIEKQFTSKVQFLIQFSHFLHKADDENKKVLLVVDDCHLLTQEMLEELRLLSNIEKAEAKLINIYYVGQCEFNDMLVQPKNRAIQQRLTLRTALKPLNVTEAEDYIRHRLKIAGKTEKLFAAKAIQIIHRYSQGVPKRINAICDHALVAGSIHGKQSIDHKTIEECVKKLNLSPVPDQKDFEVLSGDKSDLDSFKETFTPGAVESPSAVSGFNIEGDDNQGRWLKYGLGFLLVLVTGLYFWLSADQTLETAQVETVVTEQPPPVLKDIAQTNSSPAVAMLEENRNEINEKKAAELKAAILEKAYKSTENIPKEEVLRSEDATEDIGENIVRVSPLVESGTDLNKQDDPTEEDAVTGQIAAPEKIVGIVEEPPSVEQASPKMELEPVAHTFEGQVDSLTVTGAPQVREPDSENVIVYLKKGPGKITKRSAEEEVETVQADQFMPLEPKKVALGLQPNSLELTNEASRKFRSFVGKLKVYPGATVLVKGFVSSKSNSPKNIELSEKRALGVQKLLIANGINAEQIEVRGMGNQEPLAPNTTRAGRTKNRRVEIIVTSDGL